MSRLSRWRSIAAVSVLCVAVTGCKDMHKPEISITNAVLGADGKVTISFQMNDRDHTRLHLLPDAMPFIVNGAIEGNRGSSISVIDVLYSGYDFGRPPPAFSLSITPTSPTPVGTQVCIATRGVNEGRVLPAAVKAKDAPFKERRGETDEQREKRFTAWVLSHEENEAKDWDWVMACAPITDGSTSTTTTTMAPTTTTTEATTTTTTMPLVTTTTCPPPPSIPGIVVGFGC